MGYKVGDTVILRHYSDILKANHNEFPFGAIRHKEKYCDGVTERTICKVYEGGTTWGTRYELEDVKDSIRWGFNESCFMSAIHQKTLKMIKDRLE